LLGRLKRNLTFSVATSQNTIYKKAKETFGWYMTTSFQMVTRLRVMFRMMNYMQTTLKNRFYTRNAKLEILDNAWFKFLGKLQGKQLEIGDAFTSDIIQ